MPIPAPGWYPSIRGECWISESALLKGCYREGGL